MAGKDRPDVELVSLEQAFDAVVANVQHALYVPLRDERRTHDARQAKGENALAGAELRVCERVADDNGSPRLDHLSHDAVADGAIRLGGGLALDVAGRADALSHGRRVVALVGCYERVIVQKDEALLGSGHFDDCIEHGLQKLIDVHHRH